MTKDLNPETITLPPELQGRLWLSYKEFGSLLGASAATIGRWGKMGIVKVRRFTPRCTMIHVSEIERLKNGELMEGVETKTK